MDKKSTAKIVDINNNACKKQGCSVEYLILPYAVEKQKVKEKKEKREGLLKQAA